jgi:2-enoate reductase
MLPDIAQDMTPSNREFLIERLAAHNVKVVTSVTVRKILDDGVVFLRDGKEETIHSMDNIIVAAGVRSVDELSGMMKDKVAEVYVVGDARGPRKAMEAIAEGAETGCKT